MVVKTLLSKGRLDFTNGGTIRFSTTKKYQTKSEIVNNNTGKCKKKKLKQEVNIFVDKTVQRKIGAKEKKNRQRETKKLVRVN